MNPGFLTRENARYAALFTALVIGAVTISFLTVISLPVSVLLAIVLPAAVAAVILVYKNPSLGFWIYLIYVFMLGGLVKHLTAVPLGPGSEALLGFTWLMLLVQRRNRHWENLRNDHIFIAVVWFIINLIEIVNPAGASLLGWMNEVRFTSLNWLMVAPLAFVLLNRKKDLDTFLVISIVLSVLASLYGVKQLRFGVSGAEQKWLDDGARLTHVLFGKLRVFSFYTDAGQFGASQAHMGLVTLILALGPFRSWKKALLLVAALIQLYGMLISGTRGALFTLAVGVVFWLLLTRNFKALLLGAIAMAGAFFFLKYTDIGSGVYQIARLRTALDPTDASLNVRFMNQEKLKVLLKDLPFGGGVGTSGMNGTLYNPDMPLAQVPPDSYWVKVWVMYGVVGLTIWFGMVMYLLGKCCGISWNLKEAGLRTKMIALTAGTAGLFFSSYGNEVMNGIPSAILLYMSWSYVFLSPALDGQPRDRYVSLRQDKPRYAF